MAQQRASLRVIHGEGRASAEHRGVTDDEIVDAFERGDPRFGSLLYERLVDVVDATLHRLLGRHEADHDDLAQVAFEQIVITLGRRRFARACSLRSWAAAVTANVALTHIRRRKVERRTFDRRQEGEEFVVDVPVAGSPERELSAKREIEQLRAALARMSVKLAETVVMHDALGYAVPEIAVLTGTSVSAAQSRLARGRKVLTRLLGDEASRGGQ